MGKRAQEVDSAKREALAAKRAKGGAARAERRAAKKAAKDAKRVQRGLPVKKSKKSKRGRKRRSASGEDHPPATTSQAQKSAKGGRIKAVKVATPKAVDEKVAKTSKRGKKQNGGRRAVQKARKAKRKLEEAAKAAARAEAAARAGSTAGGNDAEGAGGSASEEEKPVVLVPDVLKSPVLGMPVKAAVVRPSALGSLPQERSRGRTERRVLDETVVGADGVVACVFCSDAQAMDAEGAKAHVDTDAHREAVTAFEQSCGVAGLYSTSAPDAFELGSRRAGDVQMVSCNVCLDTFLLGKLVAHEATVVHRAAAGAFRAAFEPEESRAQAVVAAGSARKRTWDDMLAAPGEAPTLEDMGFVATPGRSDGRSFVDIVSPLSKRQKTLSGTPGKATGAAAAAGGDSNDDDDSGSGFLAFGGDDTKADDDVPPLPAEMHVRPGGRPLWAGPASAPGQGTSLAARLDAEVREFAAYMEASDAEKRMQAAVVRRVADTVAKVFGDKGRLEVFGSVAVGLALPSSDIDCVALVAGERAQVALYRMGEVVMADPAFSHVQIIDSAKVPIVKMVDVESGTSVDVCFNIGDGVSALEVVASYLATYPLLRPMVIVLKYFLAQRQLNEVYTGGVGSYALINMVVAFLQHRRPRPFSDSNLGVLLVEFFRLYGVDFNYVVVGLSTTGNGSLFAKARHPHLGSGPSWQAHGRRPEARLCIEDPNNDTNDVGSGSYKIGTVRSAFLHAFRTLTATSTLADAPSILGSVIQLDERFLRRRAAIAAAFPSGDVPTLAQIVCAASASSVTGPPRADLPTTRVRKSKKAAKKAARNRKLARRGFVVID